MGVEISKLWHPKENKSSNSLTIMSYILEKNKQELKQ